MTQEFAIFCIDIYRLKVLSFIDALLAFSVVHIVVIGTPFQIFCSVISTNLILVVYLRQIIRIRDKGFRY